MSSSIRKMSRDKAKRDYERFSRAWQRERQRQSDAISVHGDAVKVKKHVADDGSIHYIMEAPGQEPTVMLGKKPSFKQWKTAVENHKAAARAAKDAEGKVEVTDAEWSDE